MKNEIFAIMAFLLLVVPAFAQGPPILYKGYAFVSNSSSNFTAVDEAIVSVEVNGAEVASTTIPTSPYPAGSGRYALQIPEEYASSTATFKINGVITTNPEPEYVLGSALDSPIVLNLTAPDSAAPAVNAGSDETSPTQITRTATASDFGSGIASYSWTNVSGHGSITFGTADAASTTISANADGSYVIRLTVTDKAGNSNHDDFTLTWNTAGTAEGSSTNSNVSLSNTTQNDMTFAPSLTTNVDLGLNTTSDVSGAAITVTEFSAPTSGATVSLPTLNKYIEIEASSDVTSALTSAMIKVYYAHSEMPSGIDESSLRLYHYNTTTGAWDACNTPYGGVDVGNNYVWAITDHFSIWGIFGSLLPSPPSGGGGGGSYTPCNTSWICNEWSLCSNGNQTRTCVKQNSACTAPAKPAESQSCGATTTTAPAATTTTIAPAITTTTTTPAATTTTMPAGPTGAFTAITTPIGNFIEGILSSAYAGVAGLILVLLAVAYLILRRYGFELKYLFPSGKK